MLNTGEARVYQHHERARDQTLSQTLKRESHRHPERVESRKGPAQCPSFPSTRILRCLVYSGKNGRNGYGGGKIVR